MISEGYTPNSVLLKPEKPLVHSWSSMNAYQQCPWRFYLTKIAKTVNEPQSKAMMDGNDFHKAMEYALRDGIPLPMKMSAMAPVVHACRTAPGQKLVEWQFGLNKNWQNTTFFGADVWIRGKIDFGIVGNKTALILDWKNGKRKVDSDQLALFAIPTFSRFPFLERVDSAYYWATENAQDKLPYTPDQLPEMKEKFALIIHRIDDSVKRGYWPKMPSGLCREHCPVGRSKCEYCGSGA